jgi:nucleotide-binding universal stress UspA family protein
VQRRICLATDLSARCDRAFDRAILLARAWDARLTIATALEEWPEGGNDESRPRWRRFDSELADAERQIGDDLEGKGIQADIVVRRASAPELLLQVAQETPYDLIVTGIARSTGLSRAILGATVETVLGKCDAPVLVVKQRARNAYRSALVGTDFSDESRAALQATAKLFPQAGLTVLHAYRAIRVIGSTAATMESDEASYRLAHDECVRFVAEALPAAAEHVQCVAEPGFPETLLNQYAVDRKLDLMSVGTKGRSSLLELLLGGTCRALILSSSCDLLLHA